MSYDEAWIKMSRNDETVDDFLMFNSKQSKVLKFQNFSFDERWCHGDEIGDIQKGNRKDNQIICSGIQEINLIQGNH